MEKQEVRGDNVPAGDAYAQQINKFRGRYNVLLSRLGEEGTEVIQSMVRESDPDIPPYSYIRHAAHTFVFPPQNSIEMHDREGIDVGVMEGTAPYKLVRVDRVAEYDEGQVQAKVIVGYDDANNVPVLSVEVNGVDAQDPVIPELARHAIDAALEPVQNQ